MYIASNIQYLIPVEDIDSLTITFGTKYNKYIVTQEVMSSNLI